MDSKCECNELDCECTYAQIEYRKLTKENAALQTRLAEVEKHRTVWSKMAEGFSNERDKALSKLAEVERDLGQIQKARDEWGIICVKINARADKAEGDRDAKQHMVETQMEDAIELTRERDEVMAKLAESEKARSEWQERHSKVCIECDEALAKLAATENERDGANAVARYHKGISKDAIKERNQARQDLATMEKKNETLDIALRAETYTQGMVEQAQKELADIKASGHVDHCAAAKELAKVKEELGRWRTSTKLFKGESKNYLDRALEAEKKEDEYLHAADDFEGKWFKACQKLTEAHAEISVVAEQRDLLAKDIDREINRRKVAEVRWKNRQDAAGRAEKALADVRGIEKVRPEGFEELTGTEIPADELKAALSFEEFNSKEQMMCGWRKVHRELHIVAVAYRRELKAREEAEKALEEERKSHAITRDTWVQESQGKDRLMNGVRSVVGLADGTALVEGVERLFNAERTAKEKAEQQVKELSAWGEGLRERLEDGNKCRTCKGKGSVDGKLWRDGKEEHFQIPCESCRAIRDALALPPPQAYAEWKEKMGRLREVIEKWDCFCGEGMAPGQPGETTVCDRCKALSDQEDKR